MTGPARPLAELDGIIRTTLDGHELEYERVREAAYFVKLPGTHKLATMCWLVAGEHALLVEAFFVRRPDENHEELYRWLLTKNAKMYAVSFCVDQLGDVYLVGRLPLSAVEPDELDRILGAVLTYSDESFDRALEIGFASSIRREWEWRRKRGESTANLQAFAHFLEDSEQSPG